ncbi:MAG: hypothetical protein E7456_03660 [Ruminococcaceae bacterium]|nr:hypothetical protein [Oscillospiraceae bacterium]
MTGKDKCKILKEIRQKIADENDIPYITEECGYKGNCKGTCPKCESELRYLEKELDKRRISGKKIIVAGLAAGMVLTMSSCDNLFADEQLAGDVSTEPVIVEEMEGEVAEIEEIPDESCKTEVLTGDVAVVGDDIEGRIALYDENVDE